MRASFTSWVLCASLAPAALAPVAHAATPPTPPTPPAASDAFLRAEVVSAGSVAGKALVAVDDPRWRALPSLRVPLAPQHAVHLGDAAANAQVGRAPTIASVKAAVAGGALALLVEWPDATEDHTSGEDPSVFGDSVAIEVPIAFGAGKRLPYVGMGDDGAHVAVFMQRATPTGSAGRDYVAAGFGSLTRANLGGSRMSMAYDRAAKKWRAVFVRPLDAPALSLRGGLVPIAFAAWDGAKNERGGNKALSSWKFVRVEGAPLDARYVEEMSWGYGAVGDLARGKQLVEGVCVACHRIGEKRAAVEGAAPDLTTVGAASTPGYLRDSLVDPHAVVVPILNINRHQARTQPRDATGAFPNNETYRWYSVDGSGKKRSRMMSFASAPPADVAAMVAYLKTLGAPSAPPASVPPASVPPASVPPAPAPR